MNMYLSQNKKIALSAVALFLVSFMGMLFFLENNGQEVDHGSVNIMDVSGGHGEDHNVDPETVYREHVGDQENPIVVINADGEVLFTTEDFCEPGDSFFDYINTSDLPDFVKAHTKLKNNPVKTSGIGPFRLFVDGKEILVLLNANLILKKEKILEFVFSLNDITEQAGEVNAKGLLKKILYPKLKDKKDKEIATK